jgi:hypothetical protein
MEDTNIMNDDQSEGSVVRISHTNKISQNFRLRDTIEIIKLPLIPKA